ncbi:hypothetical protein Y032_0498g2510, partial [Ancylostoma ceylanicum]
KIWNLAKLTSEIWSIITVALFLFSVEIPLGHLLDITLKNDE